MIRGSGDLPDQGLLVQSLKGKLFGLDVVLEVIPVERIRVEIQ